MKLYISLIFSAILIAFSAAYFALDIGKNTNFSQEDLEYIYSLKERFIKNHKPVSIINFSSLFYSRDRLQLVDPSYTSATNQLVGEEETFYTRKECFNSKKFLRSYQTSDKVWVWEEFRCSLRSLPYNFFSTPPYMHPSGKSYAYLAFLSGHSHFKKSSWISRTIYFFHLLEYEKLSSYFDQLSPMYKTLSLLSPRTLRSVMKTEKSILDNNFFLSRVSYTSLFPVLEYKFFAIEDFKKYLSQSPFLLTPFSVGKQCIYTDGNLCWKYNFTYQLKNANTKNIFLFTLSGLLVLLLTYTLIQKLKQQKREDENRRLALQVLTHEFRTPVTSLLLSLENFSSALANYDEHIQGHYLGISKDVYRLRNLVEMSRNYLRSNRPNSKIETQKIEIPSLVDFIEDHIHDYPHKHREQVELQSLVSSSLSSSKVKTDPFWFSIVLKNLVENAVNHGKAPIIIKVEKTANRLIVSIIDHGHLEEVDLKTMSQAFYKGSQSEGTGLGLNIVEKICKALDLDLEFFSPPTTFKLSFKAKEKSNE